MALCEFNICFRWDGSKHVGAATIDGQAYVFHVACLRTGATGYNLKVYNSSETLLDESSSLPSSTCRPVSIIFAPGVPFGACGYLVFQFSDSDLCCPIGSGSTYGSGSTGGTVGSSSAGSQGSASGPVLPIEPCDTCPDTSKPIYVKITNSPGGDADGIYEGIPNGTSWDVVIDGQSFEVTCDANTIEVFAGATCPVGGGLTGSPTTFSAPPGCSNGTVDVSESTITVYYYCPAPICTAWGSLTASVSGVGAADCTDCSSLATKLMSQDGSSCAWHAAFLPICSSRYIDVDFIYDASNSLGYGIGWVLKYHRINPGIADLAVYYSNDSTWNPSHGALSLNQVYVRPSDNECSWPTTATVS